MKQPKSITRQKSHTNAPKIILPFTLSTQNYPKIQLTHSKSLNEHHKKTYHPDLSKISQISQIKKSQRREKSLKPFGKYRSNSSKSLSKLISTMSKKNTVYQNEISIHDGSKKNGQFLLVDINNFKKYKHRSLSKQRSLTNLQQPHKVSQNQQSNLLLKRIKKQRSITKLQSQWTQGRAVQKKRQQQIVHKFDNQKIDRNYDHLGKLKKSTLKKGQVNRKFVTFKNMTKQINSIDKQVFQEAQKEFNRKHHPAKSLNPSEAQKQATKPKQQNQPTTIQSPKLSPKNYLKKSPSHGKKQGTQSRVKKDMNVRASADEQFLKARVERVTFERSSQDDSFFSEINAKEAPVLDEDIKPAKVRKIEDFSQSSNQLFEKQRTSHNQESIIFDKVYFFSSRLSSGFATLFSIERINLKSKANQNFIIQVVIKAYEQIVVQRIIYGKSKRNDTFRRQKTLNDKQQQKQKLKNQLFSQLIVKKQIARNRQSFPESIQLCSQKQNLLRNSQLTGIHHLNVQSIQGIRTSHNRSQEKSRQSPSSMNFSQVSPECYQQIIQYIQKYCQLQVSYLGAYLKQSDTAVPIFNQLMKKKHSQMQQTLLQSLNLAKIFYFLIKINTTYYTAKTVIIGNRKIKYYVLYEFSNMIRHQKHCIIDQEEDVGEEMGKMRKNELVAYLYHQVNKFFEKTVMNNWGRDKAEGLANTHNSYQLAQYNQSNGQNVALINALELCFGSIRQIGLGCEIDSQSQRLYKIVQSNFRNDIRWQKHSIVYNSNPNYDNFFVYHNAFDYELVSAYKPQGNAQKGSGNANTRVMFVSSIVESNDLSERLSYKSEFSYTIGRRFQLLITLYPTAIKSRHQLIRLHPTRLRLYEIQSHFIKQQFLLLHSLQNPKNSLLLESFLKKQYINSITKQIRQQSTTLPFFTVIKNKKYYVEVYVPFLYRANPWGRQNLMRQQVCILLESRTSFKRHSLKMTLGDVFLQMKQYYRLFADMRTYRKFVQTIKRFKTQTHCIPKQFLSQKLKFYVSKLYLMKKNTYSQFYFVPLPNLISEASHRASVMQKPKSTRKMQTSQSHVSQSYLAHQNHNGLILHVLQKLQANLKQQEKLSKSSLSRVKIKNFPTYEIYYKTMRRLIPGYFVILSIYYIPIFDLSEIKFYLTKIQKSFYVSVKKNVDPSQYENIIMVLLQFLKDRFFTQIIAKQSEKLSSKYKDFYSRMIRKAQSPFISKTRKNKQASGQGSMNKSSRRKRNVKRNYALQQVQFLQLTEQLLCKVFQSRRHNKYLVRLSYPSTQGYICEQKRKGIDQLINISILKQNCMLIYKFQTTARKLLSKKVTHKFNVIQLQYQEKNKPFYILFQEIKILIEESDQSTYGLLNTFRSYFMNRHYTTATKQNFISMFSLNLLSGLSSKILNNDNHLLTLNRMNHGASPYHFDSQRQINIKDLNSNLYQRFCLFMEGNQMLEVLKIRRKSDQQRENNAGNSGKLPSFLQKEMKRNKLFQRRRHRKQSIEANLGSRNLLLSSQKSGKTPNIRMTPPNTKLYAHDPITRHKIDYFIEDSYDFPLSQNTQLQSSRAPKLDEKLVYLINTQTEHATQISSSLQDTGFAINVPFGKYNRRMFRRLFRNLVDQQEGYGEDSAKDQSFLESGSYGRSVQNCSLLY